MLVRRERPGDVPAVRAVVAAAFPVPDGAAEPVEVGLLDRLRADAGWLPAFSLVAVVGDAVVGHVVATRGRVGEHPALGLGPIAVRPDHQGRGVGTAMVHAVVGAAEARDEVLVALLGEPGFYARTGFRPASELGVEAPDPAWGRYFQARALVDDPPRGPFRYAAPYDEL
ncbi:GNAT family N-acetyltransferase [Actinomycetospora straminea]|uniref:N-acetyltransferase n=1 Tax=Actinomycetospora straminea TaxID=663607 RepID=A0ABP9ESP6_9PSEU|nr:N-acetyltransferase [Actinomycetospora straminea]MDD7934061.1 N-acetyltransferase [Actinomycetospora straminea]